MSYDLMFRQALSFHEQGRFDEAENLYRQILETAPQNPDVLNLLGLVAQAKGVHNQAVELFYQAITQAPMHAPFYFNLALSLDSGEKPYEALDNYHKALKLDSTIKQAWNNIGTIYKNLNRLTEAENAYLKAIELDADYVEPQANLALLRQDAPALEALTRRYPDDALSFFFLADIFYQKQEYAKAAGLIASAVCNAPCGDAVRVLSGLINLAQNKTDEARLDFEKALVFNPLSVSALINLANIKTSLGLFVEAETHYKRALEICPKDLNAHHNYANLLYLQKRLPEALEEYRAAVVINPEIPETSNNLGIILKDIGEYEEALGLFFNAFSRKPEQEEYSINITETLVLLHNQNPEEALKIAEKWLHLSPDNIFAKHTCASFKGEINDADNRLYNEKLFDHFAENYEQIIQNIGCDVVGKLRNLTGEVKGTIVDLGCGTGLVGEIYKTGRTEIIGIDLSEKILERARRKGHYKELIKSDIFDYLNTLPRADLFIAADVFCYLGNLTPVIAAIAPQRLAFSTENTDTPDFILTPTGRFAHNPDYIENLLKSAGYEVINKQSVILRQENGKPVEGTLWFAV